MIGRTSLLTLLTAAVAALALPQPAAAAGDPEAGQRKANICQGCHNLENFRAVFPEVYRIPRIRGQSAEYIIYALKEYRSGTRFASGADEDSPRHDLNDLMSMTAIVSSLSDQDIADLAAYYSSLGK